MHTTSSWRYVDVSDKILPAFFIFRYSVLMFFVKVSFPPEEEAQFRISTRSFEASQPRSALLGIAKRNEFGFSPLKGSVGRNPWHGSMSSLPFSIYLMICSPLHQFTVAPSHKSAWPGGMRGAIEYGQPLARAQPC